MHYVFVLSNGDYVGTRKSTGRMYEARTSVAKCLDEARIFNTKGAATRAGRDAGYSGEAEPVSIIHQQALIGAN